MSLVEAQAKGLRAAGPALRTGTQKELAVLVAVEFTAQRRRLTAAARLARDAAAANADQGLSASVGEARDSAGDVDVDFEEALREFQELARSAGAEIAATLVQRRARPDPATLVGQGKLEEIEGVVASTGA